MEQEITDGRIVKGNRYEGPTLIRGLRKVPRRRGR